MRTGGPLASYSLLAAIVICQLSSMKNILHLHMHCMKFQTELWVYERIFSFVLRDAVHVLQPFFTFEEDFMKYIVVKLRERYEGWFKEKQQGYLNKLSVSGQQVDAVKDVSCTTRHLFRMKLEDMKVLQD